MKDQFPDVIITTEATAAQLPSGLDCSTRCKNTPKHAFENEKPQSVITSVNHLDTNVSTGYDALVCQPALVALEAEDNTGTIDAPYGTRNRSVDVSSEATMPSKPLCKPTHTGRACEDHSPLVPLPWRTIDGEAELFRLCDQFGLAFAHPDDLWSMYKDWRDNGKIRPFRRRKMDIQKYYLDLVDLIIIAQTIDYSALAFAALLRFQATNFEQQEDLPDINLSVIRAFEHLPVQSPLCQWIAILFAFEWSAPEDGDYDEFISKNKGLDPAALSKFLYGVAYVRDDQTEGGNEAVHSRWFNVHYHIVDLERMEQCAREAERCRQLVIDEAPSRSVSRTRKLSSEEPFGHNHKKRKRVSSHQGT